MFVKTIADTSAQDGSVSVTVADEGGRGEQTFVLSKGAFGRMSKALGRVPAELDEADEELYDALVMHAQQTAALREGARILSMGDKSARSLTEKLTSKGHSREAAVYAVDFLVSRGYLSEESSCRRTAESLVRSKKFGRRRVAEYLIAHGYDSRTAKAAADGIDDGDYFEALVCRMEKKYPDAHRLTGAERQKMMAAMMRQGFTADEINSYMKGKKEL